MGRDIELRLRAVPGAEAERAASPQGQATAREEHSGQSDPRAAELEARSKGLQQEDRPSDDSQRSERSRKGEEAQEGKVRQEKEEQEEKPNEGEGDQEDYQQEVLEVVLKQRKRKDFFQEKGVHQCGEERKGREAQQRHQERSCEKAHEKVRWLSPTYFICIQNS